MSGLRIIGRGLRDTYDNLFGFALASLGWWVACVPVLALWPLLSWLALVGFLPFGPGATVALFMVTDPRRSIDRPDLREALSLVRSNLVYGWKLAAATLIIPLVLVNNILVFGGSETWLAALAPLWLVLLLMALVYGFVAWTVAGVFGAPLGETLRRAAYVLLAAPLRSLFIVTVLLVWIVLGSLLVVPLILFVPALVAATLDRHVIRAFNLTVVDPDTPTEERLHERATGDTSTGGRLWGRRR